MLAQAMDVSVIDWVFSAHIELARLAHGGENIPIE